MGLFHISFLELIMSYLWVFIEVHTSRHMSNSAFVVLTEGDLPHALLQPLFAGPAL